MSKYSPVNDLKLRPIIAGPKCPTHRISDLMDKVLKPITKHVKGYIKDTTDFLNQLPASVENGTKLVSFDVVRLYSNIPHDLGIEAIENWINKHFSEIREDMTSEFIIDSIKFILNYNTFNFDGSHYKQVKGTAMGTQMAPTSATLVLGYLNLSSLLLQP